MARNYARPVDCRCDPNTMLEVNANGVECMACGASGPKVALPEPAPPDVPPLPDPPPMSDHDKAAQDIQHQLAHELGLILLSFTDRYCAMKNDQLAGPHTVLLAAHICADVWRRLCLAKAMTEQEIADIAEHAKDCGAEEYEQLVKRLNQIESQRSKFYDSKDTEPKEGAEVLPLFAVPNPGGDVQ